MTFHPLRIPLLCLTLLASALPLHAQDKDAQQKLEFVRQLPFKGSFPALTGFSPAQPVKGFEAQPGDHEHTQAYRSAAGCVAFFYPLGHANISEVAFQWKGPATACNGKPLEGEGELQIRRKEGDTTVVGLLQGRFSQGVLAGEGLKANFSYDKAGQPLPGTYIFQGTFANSVLHGDGMSRWSGPPDARPAAWVRQGRFQHGSLQGGVMQGRLRPYPGVEAELQALAFAEDGQVYIEQARVNGGKLLQGTLFLEGDPIAWKTELAVWRNGQIEAARFMRMDLARQRVMIVSCVQWRFEGGQLGCTKGTASAGSAAGVIGMDEGAFGVRLPVAPQGTPFQPAGSAQMRIGIDNVDMPARCDAALTRCTGRGVLPMLGSLLYWQGEIEWRDGGLRPVSATLYEQPAPPRRPRIAIGSDGNLQRDQDEDQADAMLKKLQEYEREMQRTPHDPGGRDIRVASCERFDSPVFCSRGKLYWKNGGNYAGAWRYDGVQYGAGSGSAPRYVATGSQEFIRQGWGTSTFSDGSWAEAHYDSDGDIDDVGKCDEPSSSANFRCELDGGTVVFYNTSNERRRAQRESAARVPVYTLPSAGSGRFVPQVVPQRPVYVLPGMR